MIIGLDLATQITGAAAIRVGTGITVCELERLRVSCSVEGAQRIINWLLPRSPDLVVVERPPMVLPKELDHGSQAEIGYKLGRMSGLVEMGLHAHGLPYRLVDVSDWRETMLEVSTAMGVPASRPGAQPKPTPMFGARQRVRVEIIDGTRVIVWECGHRKAHTSIEALQRVGSCPTCSATPPEMKRSDWIRDQWKRLACDLTRQHWPEPYAVVTRKARERARVEKADHELVGVADACEGAWIAVHGAWLTGALGLGSRASVAQQDRAAVS